MPTVVLDVAAASTFGSSSAVGGSASAVLADPSDATYVSFGAGEGRLHLTFEVPSMPAGARFAQGRLVGRAQTAVGATQWPTSNQLWTSIAPAQAMDDFVTLRATLQVTSVDGAPRINVTVPAGTGTRRLARIQLEADYHDRPTVTPTAPASTVTDSTRPVLAWDYDQPDGLDQSAWRVAIVDDDGTPVWDTGWTSGPATQVQPPTDLDNGETYHAQYAVRAKWPGLGHLESSVATRTFTLDLVTPASPTVAVTPTPTQGRTLIEIDDPGGDLDAEWYSVEFHDGDGRWTTLRAAGHLDATAGPVLVWDHEAPFNRPRTYRVRAHAQVGAEQVASPPTDVDGKLIGDGRWLTDPRDPAGLHMQVLTAEHERSWQGREQVHLPAGLDVAVVESEPTVLHQTLTVWALDPAEHATLVAALRSTRTLLYRDWRSSVYFRWVGDRTARQHAKDWHDTDQLSGTMVEVARPCT